MKKSWPSKIKQSGPRDAGLGCRLAAIAGANAASVTALYLGQVLAKALTCDFPGDAGFVSLVPTATFAGYAIGVGIIAFGSARRIRLSITAHIGLLTVALCAAGLAPTIDILVVASLAIGGGAAVAQRLLATAGRLGGVMHGGTFIGKTICIALTAVLGLRLAGDSFAKIVGWRTIFFVAAATAAAFGLLNHWLSLRRVTSRISLSSAPTTTSSHIYPLWRQSALLRWAIFQHGAMFSAYHIAWITVAVEAPTHERLVVVFCGGGVGILAALLAGYFVDRFAKRDLARYGVVAVAVATTLLLPLAYNSVPGLERALFLLSGMALLDGGLQIALVANQTRIQLLLPEARPRLAAMLTVCGSIGGAVGAGGGYWCWNRFGWQGAIGLAAVFGQIGFCCALLAKSKQLNDRVAPINQDQCILTAAMARPIARRGLCWPASPMSLRKESRTA